MQRKNVVWIILLMLVATAMINRAAVGLEFVKVSVSPIVSGPGLTVGDYFNINVTVDDATKLFGYQFLLRYNTTILTAINYTNLAYLTYTPLVDPSPSSINDTAGWVSVAYSCPMGEGTGLTTTVPVPLARIWFRVDVNGTTPLDIDADGKVTQFGDIYGHTIRYPYNMIISDGIFSNVAEIKLHDVAITSVTVNATNAKPGDTISITINLKNNGDFTESVSVNAKYNISSTAYKEPPIGTKTVSDFDADDSTTVNFDWKTTGVAEGKYVILAGATLTNETNIGDNIGYSDLITLKSESTGGLPIYIYIAAAVVVVAVIGVGFYALRRRRKPE